MRAWELSGKVDPQSINLDKYMELLAKAGGSVLLPFGIDPEVLMEWTLKGGVQLPLPIQVNEMLSV
mgnify:FL=1